MLSTIWDWQWNDFTKQLLTEPESNSRYPWLSLQRPKRYISQIWLLSLVSCMNLHIRHFIDCIYMQTNTPLLHWNIKTFKNGTKIHKEAQKYKCDVSEKRILHDWHVNKHPTWYSRMCIQVNRLFGTSISSELIPTRNILCKCNLTGKWYQTDDFNPLFCHSKHPKWFSQASSNSPNVIELLDAIIQAWWRKCKQSIWYSHYILPFWLLCVCVRGVCVSQRDAPVECLRTRSEPLRTEALRSPRDLDDLISLCLSWPLTWRNCGEVDIYNEFW